MKKLYMLVIAILLVITNINAQTPESFKYQAVLRDASGNVKSNVDIETEISILQGSETGTAVYTETHNTTTNSYGLINLNIGEGTTSDDFNSISWGNSNYFVKVSVDGIEFGTSPILSVPYALHAKTAENVFSGNYNDLEDKPNLSVYLTAESDPGFAASPAAGITESDIDGWNTTSSFSGSFNDLTDVPVNLDTNSIDDFSGDYNDLTNKPDFTGWDTNVSDDFDGNYSSLTGTPTNVSAFTNDIGYITNANDTSATNELQNLFEVLAQGNDAGNNNIINLAEPINDKDAVTKAYVDELESQLITLMHTLIAGGVVTDIEGNVYNTVKIGDQIWMAENLKTTKYNDNTEIPLVTDNDTWSNLTTPGYCWYNNDSATYNEMYGILYNWYTVNTGNLCPTDWHVPSHTEWVTLMNYLGGASVAGGKLKESGTTHWTSPNTGATNETGFTGLPGGRREGAFSNVGNFGSWWTATQTSATHAWGHGLHYLSIVVSGGGYGKTLGYSVRCVKD